MTVCGRRISAEDALKEILKDRVFYEGDGGVTFSGGECLLQADFVAEVLSLAKKEGLHTAIDTCGCVNWEAIEKTLEYCDLYLYDVKCVSTDTHKGFTGVDNYTIIENLKKLSKTGKEIWIRTPVIPGFNDTKEEMTQIAEKEAAAELLLQAKGFSDVIVSINGKDVDVVVNALSLSDAQRAQIEDIVKRKTDISADNIIISTVVQ